MKIHEDWKKELIDNDNTLHFSSLNEFIDFIEKNNGMSGCIFRGQRNPSWKLEPSFFRGKSSMQGEILQGFAFDHLDRFKKFTRGRHKISYTDPNDEDDNWWGLGQHYGLNTPFLDWVRTPYVAVFFAFNEKQKGEKYRSIFILDVEGINCILDSYRGTEPLDRRIELIDPLTHENKRLVSQQGVFTYVRDYSYKKIEDYLSKFYSLCSEKINENIFLLKINILSNKRKKILNQLDLMNINRSTLFPDLTGSAEYCNYLLEKNSSK